MLKLSELDKDVIVIGDDLDRVYTVKDIKDDLQDWQDEGIKFYIAKEYHANIDAQSMLVSAIDSECEHEMYDDWDEKIWEDITEEDIEKIQVILDDIFSRNKEQNISYREDEEIDIFN